MIQKLLLSNFQSHKNTDLEFSDGVNVIIGGSDSGKTSIIRALKWLIFNRPSGEAFRSTWGGSTYVQAMIDDIEVTRLRNNIENGYRLGTQTHFEAIKTDVPEEITKHLNLNEINLQSQMDSPFLLSNSPGEVAKHFNKIAHLNQIDGGLKTIQGWIRGIEQDIRSGESQVKQSQEELEKFDHLEKFEANVEVLEDMQSRFLQQVNNVRVLKTLIEAIETTEEYISVQSEILTLEPLLNKILGWIEERKQTVKKHKQLGALKEELDNVNTDIEDHAYIVTAEKPVDDLLKMYSKREELEGLSDSIWKLIANIFNTKELLTTNVNRFSRLEKEFEDNFPELCPLCGKPYKE